MLTGSCCVRSPMFCLTPFLMDVRFLRGRRGELFARKIYIRKLQAGPGETWEAMRLEFFPLVKIEFITIDKENLWGVNTEQWREQWCLVTAPLPARDLTSCQPYKPEATPHNTTQWHHAGVKHIFSASSQMFCFVSRLKWWLQQALHYNSKLYHRPQISVLVHSAGCFKLIKTKLPWKPTQWGFITSTLLYNWPATFAHLWYW